MKLSVLMSIFHKENPSAFDKSLQSILIDQSLKPDQLVLVKDGILTPELDDIIEKWRHNNDKICIVSLPHNMGLASALNHGLAYCDYELVARMDTDDIALPQRLEKQVLFMLNNPDITVCSAYIEEKSDDMKTTLSTRILPITHEEIVKFAKTRSPISHPAAAYRKSAILDVGGYPKIYPEDYPLWCMLIAKGYKFANIPEVLLHMRSGEGMISRRGYKFLKGYIQTYLLMKKLKLIGWPILIRNIAIQFFVRLSPTFIRKLLYKYARN